MDLETKTRLVRPFEVVDLYWDTGVEGNDICPSIQTLSARREELIADFREWYRCYQEVIREEEQKNPPEVVDVYPSEDRLIISLLESYESRLDAKAGKYRVRRIQFEMLARLKWSQEVIYREGNTLFVAKLLRTEVVSDRVDLTLQISPLDNLTFVPPIFACDLTPEGDLIVNARWESFWCDDFRWFEAQIGWNIYFSDSIRDRLLAEANAFANEPRNVRFSRLAAILVEEVCRRGEKYHPNALPWLVSESLGKVSDSSNSRSVGPAEG